LGAFVTETYLSDIDNILPLLLIKIQRSK